MKTQKLLPGDAIILTEGHHARFWKDGSMEVSESTNIPPDAILLVISAADPISSSMLVLWNSRLGISYSNYSGCKKRWATIAMLKG